MYPQYVSPNNSMKFVSENNGDTYNLCHCTCLVVYPSARLG